LNIYKLIAGAFAAALFGLAAPVHGQGDPAEEAPSAGTPDAAKITDKTELEVTVSSLPELQLSFRETFIIPFLRGSGALTKDNNLSPSFSVKLTPVSLSGAGGLEWTPAAFFVLSTGFEIGSGWNWGIPGLGSFDGIGVNRIADDGESGRTDGSAFDGLIYKFYLGTTLQGDLAAFWPGEWHHIVFLAYNEVNYNAYTGAGAGETWFLLDDSGENRNGFNYYGSFLFGYQTPLFLNMAAFMAEAEQYLTRPEGGEQWGDELPSWVLSALFTFKLPRNISAALICQFRTLRNYDGGQEYSIGKHYSLREIDKNNPQSLRFYRVAAVFKFRLR